MATAQQSAAPEAGGDSQKIVKMHEHPPLYDLGKVKSKHAKKLKKGTGKLMDEATQTHLQLQSGLDGTHTPLFISYEEKPGKKKKKKKIKFMGLKIDRKKFKNRIKKNGIRAKFL